MRSSWRHVGWLLVTASAFAVGFYVKRPTPEVIEAPVAVAKDMPKAESPAPRGAPKGAKTDLHDLIIPDGPGTPPEQIPIPKNDPSIAEIRKQMGHNTGSLLDEPKPLNVPIILTSDKKELLPEPVPPREFPKPPDAAAKKSDDFLLPPLPEPTKPDINIPLAPPPPIPYIPRGTPVVEVPKERSGLFLKSRDIQLSYETTKAGPSGIKFVEVWARNIEHTNPQWVKLERLPSGQKPLTATLPSEGLFELTLVLESESGMRSAAPHSKTVADHAVEVDLTPPMVTAPKVSPSTQAGTVLIEWAMTDKNLSPSSGVSLEYSSNGSDWHPIPIPKPMSQRLGQQIEWTIPTGIGHQVHLRVTAQDAAGNSTTQATPSKVSVDLVTPAGRITSVRPSKSEAEQGPMPREAIR